MPGLDQIIDLTQPPDFDVEIESQIQAQTSSGHESRRNRRRKSRRSTANSNPALTDLPQSNSLERIAQAQRSITLKCEDLLREHPMSQCVNGKNQEIENAKGSDQNDSFFIDLTAATIPPISQRTPPTSNQPNDPQNKLLVPSHVTVLGNTPTEIEIVSSPLSDSGDDDFINYLDYEDSKVRANCPS
jgi:protein AIR1/2